MDDSRKKFLIFFLLYCFPHVIDDNQNIFLLSSIDIRRKYTSLNCQVVLNKYCKNYIKAFNKLFTCSSSTKVIIKTNVNILCASFDKSFGRTATCKQLNKNIFLYF